MVQVSLVTVGYETVAHKYQGIRQACHWIAAATELLVVDLLIRHLQLFLLHNVGQTPKLYHHVVLYHIRSYHSLQSSAEWSRFPRFVMYL